MAENTKLGLSGTPAVEGGGGAAAAKSIYRWRGKILMHMCSGSGSDPYDRAIAVDAQCCCPPCVYGCCCANPPDDPGKCAFYIRGPQCCAETSCVTPPTDPQISAGGGYYQGGRTQIVNYKNFIYCGSSIQTVNAPYNDYALCLVHTQNQPSWLNFNYCVDKARYEWHFIPGCTFIVPICVESYTRDPYCAAENKASCDPCDDVFADCCGSTFNTISQSQFVTTMGLLSNNDENECPNCGLNNPSTCIPYLETICRTNSGPVGYLFMYLFNFGTDDATPEGEGCKGSVTKKCCFTTSSTNPNNRVFYSRLATIATATLVGATECDGTDNNPGGIGSPYNPTQDTISCDYPIP